MSHQIDAEFIAHNATTDTDALVATVREALPKHHVTAERDYAPHPALAALDSLAAELGRLQKQQRET